MKKTKIVNKPIYRQCETYNIDENGIKVYNKEIIRYEPVKVTVEIIEEEINNEEDDRN